MRHFIIFTILYLTLAFSANSHADTIITNNITTNTTWNLAGSPYIIQNSIAVEEGATLTIEPDVVVKLASAISITSYGVLIADGTSDQVITFTSNKPTPAAGDWKQILLNGAGANGSVLDHCVVEYGGYSNNPNIYVVDCSPSITNCTIRHSSDRGVYVTEAADCTITGCTFEDISNYPICIYPNGLSDFFGNNTFVATGIYDAIYVQDGTITADVTLSAPPAGFSYYISSQLYVKDESNPTLTFQTGSVVKFGYHTSLYIGGANEGENGKLIANGTTFTSYRNDSVAGNTNGGADNEIAYGNDWRYIYFYGNADNNSALTGCTVEYGGYGSSGNIYLNNCSPSITNSTIRNSGFYGIYANENSAPTITGCTFEGNDGYPIRVYADGLADFYANNIFNVNGSYDAIEISGGTITSDVSLSGCPAGFSYYISSQLYVKDESNPTLTFQSGSIVKMGYHTALYIGGTNEGENGKLVSDGTTFTSYRNDSVAGNTNGGADNEIAYGNDWRYIYFYGNADNSSVLSNCTVEYGGYGSSGNIYLNNCSPSITGSTIRTGGSYGISGNENSAPTITGCTFEGNGSFAISVYPAGLNDFYADNTFNVSDSYDGVQIYGGTITSDISLSAPSEGFCYYVSGNLHVKGESNPTLTFQSGSIVKMTSSSGLYIGGNNENEFGKLIADGTTFTSYRNDSIAGNTNGGADNEIAYGNDWRCIYFLDKADDSSVLSNCTVEYGGYGSAGNIYFNNCSPTITGSTIRNGSSYGISASDNSIPTITGCTFEGNENFAISIYPAGLSDFFANNTFNVSDFYDAVQIYGGTITSDISLSAPPEGFCYYLAGKLYVKGESNPTLTFQSGSIVKVTSSQGIYIGGSNENEFGKLIADGTTFTSYRNDSVAGNTNGGADNEIAYGNDWCGIYLYNNADDSSVLSDCIVEYGGYSSNSNIYLTDCNPTIINSTIRNSNTYGIYADQTSVPAVNGCTFEGNGSYPISVYPAGLSDFYGNNTFNLRGSYDAIQISGGTLISDISLSEPPAGFCYYISSGVYVKDVSNPVLTIQPGSVVKMSYSSGLYIGGSNENDFGKLIADSVTFTSYRNDSVVGNTNGGIDSETPYPGDWRAVYFYDKADDSSVIENSTFSYGGYSSSCNIRLENCDVPITNCIITNSSTYGIYANSASSITGCTIKDNNNYGIECTSGFNGIINNCTFQGNGSYAIRISANHLMDLYGNNTFNSSDTFDAIEIIAGTITSDLTLSTPPAGFSYFISGTVTVKDTTNPVLTFQPGTVIKLQSYGKLNIGGSNENDFGKLIADGVTFTSYRDDATNGNTNGGNDDETPHPGDWGNIYFYKYADDSSVIDNCTIKYAGYSTNGSIYMDDANPNISNTTFKFNEDQGIYANGSSSSITNCIFQSNGQHGIYCNSDPSPTIESCTFQNNGNFPVHISASYLTDLFATNTFTSTGAYDAISITSGTITSDLSLSLPPEGFCYHFSSAVTVKDTTNPVLTFQPGTVVKLQSYGKLNIGGSNENDFGKLIADGVTFTSYRDDATNGNTNGGNDDETPYPGDWGNLYFYNYADDNSVLNNCIIQYGGYNVSGNIYLQDCNVDIDNCTILYSEDQGIYANGSSSSITNCTFNSNGQQGIYCNAEPHPAIENCTFQNNGNFPIHISASYLTDLFETNTFTSTGTYDAIDITSGTITSNLSLSLPPEGFCYYFSSAVTVKDTTNPVLTFQPGTVVKLTHYAKLNIGGSNPNDFGKLMADGVTFTSYLHDSLIGNTNGGADDEQPISGTWGNINFSNYADDSSVLKNCTIQYGGYNVSGLVYLKNCNVDVANSTIQYSSNSGIYADGSNSSITNCVFDDNAQHDIYCNAEPHPAIENCTFQNNGNFPIRIFADYLTDLYADNTFISKGIYDAIDVAGGNITSDLSLSLPPAGFCYYFSHAITVKDTTNPVLTFQPGTVVKLTHYGRLNIGGNNENQFGKLIANGITFTSSYHDSLIGNTNGGADDEQPAPGNWGGIYFYDYSDDSSELDNCTIQYGGWNTTGNISIDDASVPISNSIVNYSSSYGIYIEGESVSNITGTTILGNGNSGLYCSTGNPMITNCQITGNNTNNLTNHGGVYATSSANPVFDNCTIANNNQYGIFAYNYADGDTVEAINNYWGTSTGPYHATSNPSGTGNPVSDNVKFMPYQISQQLEPEIAVSPGNFHASLTVGESDAYNLIITNNGNTDLTFSITDEITNLQEDAAWLTYDIASGTIPVRRDTTVAVTFDAGSLSPDTYTANLLITHNDPSEDDPLIVPVTLTVTSASISIDVELCAGFNLISLPVDPGTSDIPTILSSIEGLYSTVQRYDCSAGNFEVYYAGAFPPDEFTTIEPDVGYWINMSQPATLTLTGTPLAEMRSLPLCAGFNLIGWSSPNTTLVETGLQSIDGGFSTVQRYNCTTGNFEVYYAGTFPPDEFTDFEPGKGYWINATTAITWSYDPATARIILRHQPEIKKENKSVNKY